MEYSCASTSLATGESEDGTMTCSDGLVIYILSATFGRKSYTICTKGKTDAIGKATPTYNIKRCTKTKDLTSYAQDECDEETSCTFIGTSSMEGDPCGGIYKYTWIYYTCRVAKICK